MIALKMTNDQSENDGCATVGIVIALLNIRMIPLKRHQNGRIIDIIQWVGLILLIGFTHRHFGPEARTPITPSVIGIFGAAVFLLLGPIPLKFKE
jgi:hypothetical protein